MLELNKSDRRISFGKEIVVIDKLINRKANVKYIIENKEINQIFIITDDFLVVCRYRYGGEIESFEKCIFVSLPDSSNYLLSYYMMLGIPIYQGKNELEKIEAFGFTYVKENIIDKNTTTTTVD